MADRPAYVYVTYIEASAEAVFHALTDAELSGEYWGHSNVSDWQVGSSFSHVRTDGSEVADVIGTILEIAPPRRLVLTFDAPGPVPAGGPSVLTFVIEEYHQIVKLTVLHENLDEEGAAAVGDGWPAVFANLKSLLETGHVLPQAPWEMHAERRAQLMGRNDSA